MTGTVTGLGHGAREGDVEAVARAVAVHAGEQDFACAGLRHASRPIDGVDARGAAPAVGVDLPRSAVLLRVDRHYDALAADDIARLAHERRVLDRGGIDRDLVRARVEQAAHIGDLAHAAADGERDEHALGDRLDDVQQEDRARRSSR